MADKPAIVLTITEMARRGGIARARKLSRERQSEIGRKAAAARWAAKNSPDPNEPTRADLRPVSDKGTSIMLNSRRRRGPKPCHRPLIRKEASTFVLFPEMEGAFAAA